MSDALWGAAIGALPSLATAYWLYRQNDRSGERQRESEKERLQFETDRMQHEGRSQALADKRRRYEAYLHATAELAVFLRYADAVATKRVGNTPPSVPEELLDKLSAGTAAALLEAPDELAPLLTEVHDELAEQVAQQHLDGPGYNNGVVSPEKLQSIRELMRADLDNPR